MSFPNELKLCMDEQFPHYNEGTTNNSNFPIPTGI